MHGTGTALGDPIEVGAACAVLGQVRLQLACFSVPKRFCGLLMACCGDHRCSFALEHVFSVSYHNCAWLPRSQHTKRLKGTGCQDSMQPMDLAAAKSRAGHAEACAGAVGLVFATRRLSTCATAPIAHLRSANTHITSILGASRTRAAALLPREPGPGVCGAQQHAGISAFAFQVLESQLCTSHTVHMLQLNDNCTCESNAVHAKR